METEIKQLKDDIGKFERKLDAARASWSPWKRFVAFMYQGTRAYKLAVLDYRLNMRIWAAVINIREKNEGKLT